MSNPFLKTVSFETAERIIKKSIIIMGSLVVAFVLLENRTLHQALEFTNPFQSTIGSLIAGVLFTSVFTTPIAISTLFILGQNHNPLLIASIAAVGSVLGDTIILKVIREDLAEDIAVVASPFVSLSLRHILKSRLLHLPLIVLGSLVIASPLPDEIGIAILNFAHVKPKWFYAISFALNFIGIFVIASLGQLNNLSN